MQIAGAAAGWFGWIFFLIGVGFLVVVYLNGFRPQNNGNGLRLFEKPDDIDLWTGTAIAVAAFSGAGAAMLAHR